MDTAFVAYVAGFFDGEGSVSISKNRVRGAAKSEYHKIIVKVSQRTQHRKALDLICAEFGGSVCVKKQRVGGGFTRADAPLRWAEQSEWTLQKWADIERFLIAVQPHVVVKRKQVEIALAFIRTRSAKTTYSQDSLGRVRRDVLTDTERDLRESYRAQMLDANHLGPPPLN